MFGICSRRFDFYWFLLACLLFLILNDAGVLGSLNAAAQQKQMVAAQDERGVPTFTIRRFEITGNSLYPTEILQEVLKEFIGPDKAADDVEKARALLEKFYQENGYVRVLVNIPEQVVENGTIKLQVTESRIGKVLVTGNRYFTKEMILHELPALQPGKILYVPDVEKELRNLNRNQNLTVRLSLQPGRDLGVDDVLLKVEDSLPLNGRLELSNRSTHNTSELRLNGMLRYDNLWQKGHSVSLQYQTAPQKPKEVQVVGASYVLPAPWAEKHLLATYALWTDSDTAFGEGFSVTGKGFIVGARYLLPLPQLDRYFHSLSLGVDYKDFQETVGFVGEEDSRSEAPISYLPFAVEYNGTFVGETGATRLKAGLNWAFRGLMASQKEFDNKRLYARGDYLYLKYGLERNQKLPWEMRLNIGVDGQIASEPLVSSEQFSAGGMESVRGYKESDSLGDDGIHGSIEWQLPDIGKAIGGSDWLQLTPYLFYDFARLWVQQAQDSQTDRFNLNGTGLGVRGGLWKSFEYEVDVAQALSATDHAESGDIRCHFFIRYIF